MSNYIAKTVTLLLRAWHAGDQAALRELMPLVYAELRRLAARHLQGERAEGTFRPTELVSEAYVRLAEGSHPECSDRHHFVAIAARTMRQILVDHARKRNAAKRNGGERPVMFDDELVAVERPESMLALEEALSELGKLDGRKARVIELYYFGGLTQQEVAEVLDVHVNTIGRDLEFATAWIARCLRGDS